MGISSGRQMSIEQQQFTTTPTKTHWASSCDRKKINIFNRHETAASGTFCRTTYLHQHDGKQLLIMWRASGPSPLASRRHIADEGGDAMGPVASQSQVAVPPQPAIVCLCPHGVRRSRPQPAATPSEHRQLCELDGKRSKIYRAEAGILSIDGRNCS
jgi:hypothetical protein